jgi:hypothetical protein
MSHIQAAWPDLVGAPEQHPAAPWQTMPNLRDHTSWDWEGP